jgi:type I restriction enzyme, S subunit
MIADLKPYAAYKDSGLAWLGQVPEHWTIGRIKTVLQELDHRSTDGTGTLLSLTRVRGLIPHSDRTDKIHSASTLVGYKGYQPGEIVMNRMQAWSGMFGAGPMPGLVSPDYAVFKILGGHDTSLMLARLKTPDMVGQFALESKGIGSGFNRLYTDSLGPIPISLPPPEEQAAIVRFLDWANARLERTIRAKRRVIALLTEQKQAIIHRAVTRGLDPAVPLKPSGIAWLGNIPAHWELQNLGRAIRLITGFPFASGGFSVLESDMRLVRGINVTPSGLRWNSVVRWQRTTGDGLDDFALQVGDIVLGMDRPIIGAGVRAACVEENDVPSLLLQRVARLRPTTKLDADYLLLLLRGRLFSDYMTPIFTGISVPHLSPEQIKGFKVALPPLSEQQAICEYVGVETLALNTAISRLHREIDLLREYRTRLVADVVTGKLDVREAAAALPQDTQPSALAPDALDSADLGDDGDDSDEVDSDSEAESRHALET